MYRYSFKVYGDSVIEDANIGGQLLTNCFARVYDYQTSTDSTIYADNAGKTKDNWISRSTFGTDGGVEFYSTKLSHTVNIADDKGNCGSYDVTPQTRAVKLNQTSPHKCMVIHYIWSDDDGTGTEVNTGLKLPPGAMITRVERYARTSDGSVNIRLGLLSTESGGDADGFITADGVSTGAGAEYESALNWTAGSNAAYINENRYGAYVSLNASVNSGTDVVGDNGNYYIFPYFSNKNAAKTITYTFNAGADTAEGLWYLFYHQTV